MQKKIFRTMLALVCGLLLLLTVMFAGGLYGMSRSQLTTSLTEETAVIAASLKDVDDAADYLKTLPANRRITLIASDGTVLFDSSATPAAMENHADREEFIGAQKTGSATVTRASTTLAEEMIYHTLLLAGGDVLRLAAAQQTLLGYVGSALPWMLLALAACALLAGLLAAKATTTLVKPITAIDPEHPLENDCYEELTPLLRKLHQQQQENRAQLEKLRTQKQEQDAMLSRMSEGLALLDAKDRILTINDTARLVLRAGDGDMTGCTLLEIDRNVVLQQLLDKVKQYGTSQGDLDAAGRHWHIRMSRVGEDEGTLMLFEDDTADRQAETMRRQFTANVSHELRTPLTTISGYAELMENHLAKPEDEAVFISRIRRESARMLSLVEDILRLSQLDEGDVRLRPVELDLAETAQDVAASLAPKAEDRGVAIDVSKEHVELTADPTLVHEILYNLMDNGVKYNREGGHVQVTVREQEKKVALIVRDDGIGIPSEHQKKIFERFYRVDKSRSKATGGTGLGLSIVKHAAQLLDADIMLESKEGEGTTVTVLFPQRNI